MEWSSNPNASWPETQTLVSRSWRGLSGHGQGLPVQRPLQLATAPQLLHTQTAAGCEQEDKPGCSSFLYLEFRTPRIWISTTLLIQGLKRALDELSCWLRWRKGMALWLFSSWLLWAELIPLPDPCLLSWHKQLCSPSGSAPGGKAEGFGLGTEWGERCWGTSSQLPLHSGHS